MTVWIVYVPWDYDSAEIVGVFMSEESAKREARNKRSELSKTTNIRIQKCGVCQ